MLRGQQSLYNSLFPSSVTVSADNKGKRNVFIDERNEAIACRYYFYAEVKRLRFDDCLLKLQIEFYLSPTVVSQILTQKLGFIKDLVNRSKEGSIQAVFKKRYAHLKWD